MAPSLPTPRTASFLSESLRGMVNALPNNERLTRSSPDSLAATLAAQPSMSLVPLAPFLDFARNDNWMQRHVARRNTADSFEENRKRLDSFAAWLSCSYLRCATVHVARPTRSILDSRSK